MSFAFDSVEIAQFREGAMKVGRSIIDAQWCLSIKHVSSKKKKYKLVFLSRIKVNISSK